MLDKFKTAFVLTLIGALSGVSIYFVNDFTEEFISENIRVKEEGFYKDIFGVSDDVEITFTKSAIDDLEEVIVYLKDDNSLVGYIYKASDKNNYGDITVLVGVKDGNLENVVISKTTNTPNFANIIKQDYLQNFTGQSTSDVTFDAKTGASYTYGSVEDIVTSAVEYYNAERGDE